VLYVEWEYSESGWDVEHNGCSLHLKEEDIQIFVDQYCETLPKDHVPEGYSRPSVHIKPFTVKVSDELYSKIQNSKQGIMMYEDAEEEAITNRNLVTNRPSGNY